MQTSDMKTPVVEGVYLGERFDLNAHYGAVFAPYADRIRLRSPGEIDDPESIRFALAWYPADDAFTAYPNLKLACSIAAGVDSILACPSLPDAAYVTRVQDDSQADLMAGFAAWQVVWHHRNMGFYLDRQAKSIWEHQDFDAAPSPCDYTVGLLGYGLMGRAVARAVAAMGFPVVAAARSTPTTPSPAGVSFETGMGSVERVAARAQALINVLPLTPATEGILNKDLFDLMPRGARLIQIGRGEHLVDADLVAALDSGQLGGASLDVFHTEPLPPDHPWWTDDRILITPHQASDSSRHLMAKQVVQAACDVALGKAPKNTVDHSRGY
ncbi:NAD(P)-dependent oxidoreductase [Roseibium aggregatum]|uniref:Hydroxyacid dehydrogenase n=1 Tax=Roseibium aggregatum TaxID=187304 RepID=A0A939ELK3_9HYPH|nr:NAD(P)-dependent oxidoreductase [Roseibium aggregatum]MBN9673795.1 hydroxyacid dehydrogenase [Roseibium aggregatum]